MESQKPSGGDTIFGGENNTQNVTLDGDVIAGSMRLPPPEEVAIACRFCGTKNWPSARFCAGCNHDFQAGRTRTYRALNLALLAVCVLLLLILVVRS